VSRRERSTDGSTRGSSSKLRRILFWAIYVTAFVLVVAVLVFPYDKIVEKTLVDRAARNDVNLEFESFDYKFPSRIVCKGVTVKSAGDTVVGGNTYWRELDCELSVRALLDGQLDVTGFHGVLSSGSDSEGDYVVDGSFSIAGIGNAPGTAAAGRVLHISRLTVHGQGVNVSMTGDVTIRGSAKDTGVDLSVNIEQLDRVTSANKSLQLMFMTLRFAMGQDEAPIKISMRGQGANTVVEKQVI